MQTTTKVTKRSRWAGGILTALVVLFMAFDIVSKLMKVAPVLAAQTRLGYPEALTRPLAAILLACTAAYVIPRTAIVGAILLTAYLGGATASHVRIGEPWFFPVLFGVVTWLALVLRDERLRALLTIKRGADWAR
ncbi:MAG: hypothetical protein JWM53_3596 [bacterium]|nr:hypothetical protein [bacterium]